MRKDESKKSVRNEMMQFIEDKYHEDFTFVSINSEVWSADYTEMLVESSSYPGKKFPVHRDKKTGEITDGYLPLKLNSGVEQEITSVATLVYGECKVFNNAQTSVLPASYSTSMTASDFLKKEPKRTNASVFVIADSANKEDDVENFRKALMEKGYYLSFSILYVSDANLSSISQDNYSEFLSGNQTGVNTRGDFVINDSFVFSYSKWR